VGYDIGADLAKTNVNGAIAIGHPLDASGAASCRHSLNALEPSACTAGKLIDGRH
jgi:acetyl-CoA acetyltransferase